MDPISNMLYNNWLTSKVEVRHISSGSGCGSFAIQNIDKGEIIAAFGGLLVNRQELLTQTTDRQARSIQIETDLYLLSGTHPEPGDMVNHSCDPNCGLSGQMVVIALRPIDIGEQCTFDYAMCDGYPDVLFSCECKSPQCRGNITGNDWMLPELQERYNGYFSPYLARKISSL